MEFKDYYKTLGVDKGASPAEVKRAFRKLARESHPDLHAGDAAAEGRFKEINEAYEVLGNPETRKKYDELGANWRMYEQAARDGGGRAPAGWSVHAGGGPWQTSYQTVDADRMRDLFGSEDPFSDFFHTFFGGRVSSRGSGRSAPRERRGRDVEHPVDLTLEEAFTGASRRIRLAGSGANRTIDVRIPAGVRDGSKVRAAGEGGSGQGGGQAGDLFLVVRILPHARFELRGQDFHTRVSVPVTTAVLGGETAVPTLSGTTLRLKIPAQTPVGQVFRLKGHGMPTPGRPEERGDLYAKLDVQLPATLSDEERAHYEALRSLGGRPS